MRGMLLLAVVMPTCCEPVSAQTRTGANLAPHVQQRVEELKHRFANDAQASDASAHAEITVKALVAIVEGSFDSRLKHRALKELGRHPDDAQGVECLVQNIDFEPPVIGGTDDPLGSYSAARALLNCGPMARRAIFRALAEPLADHKRHLMAHVLATLDHQADQPDSGVPIAVFRLTREIERLQHPDMDTVPPDVQERVRNRIENMRRMVDMLLEPGFIGSRIPLPPEQ